MKVYLAGPINGCTDDESQTWRELLKKSDLPILWIDPMIRDYRGKEDQHYKEIVEADIEDIKNSEVVVANCWMPSYGTAMEIFYAHLIGRSVIIIHPADKPISPWLKYHSYRIVFSIPEVIEILRRF